MRLLVHGGAGTLSVKLHDDAIRAAVSRALAAGWDAMADGALASVLAAVQVLEDAPELNAGRGAVYCSDGQQRMDASVMVAGSAGSVGSVQGVRSPILLAEAVRSSSPHVLLVGAHAEAFADAQGLERKPLEWFASPFRLAQQQRAAQRGVQTLDHDDAPTGTVGAVAVDAQGRVAAATSTGGMTNKHPGRVGDTGVIGAGTWADGRVAVSATGHGERFIEANVAGRIAARMELLGEDVHAASAALVDVMEPGTGGVIAVAADGSWAMPFVSRSMIRGMADANGVWTELRRDDREPAGG
jgi:beta-aspartyl-peptidase (threonine type)